MSLPRYAEYKECDEQWLESIPKSWVVQAISRVLAIPITDGPHTTPAFVDDGVPFLSVDGIQEGNLVFDGCRYVSEADHTEFSIKAAPRRDDILMAKAASVGKVARVKADFKFSIWSPLALIRVDESKCLPAFMEYSLKAPWLQAQVETRSNSNTQLNIGMKDIPKLRMCLPPIGEQSAIAAFLDRETGKIDALIAEQEKLLTLLAEKRQATISHAVTRGLNPNAPMKDSGVLWLGEVPAHWGVVPLMHLTATSRPIMYGIVLPGPNVDDGIPIVKGGDVRLHKLKVDLLNRTTIEVEAPYARARLRPMDIVYSIRGTIGDAETVPDELLDANITQDVARISPAEGIQTRWLLYAMKSRPVFVQLEQRSLGAAVRGINIFELKRAKIPVPPTSERVAIAGFLDAEIEKLDLLTSNAEKAIQLFKERRSALIAAAVTGKIDVRREV